MDFADTNCMLSYKRPAYKENNEHVTKRVEESLLRNNIPLINPSPPSLVLTSTSRMMSGKNNMMLLALYEGFQDQSGG